VFPDEPADTWNPLKVELQATDMFTVYLPLVMRVYPPPPLQFGVQMHKINESRGLNHLTETGNYWIRFRAFAWDEIEPQRTEPPTYDWNVVDEASLQSATDNGMEVIGIVQFTPDWAQKYPGVYCGPVKQSALDEFAEFMKALVERYSKSPYNVRYWELGNEPDVDPSLVSDHSVFGCWGDEDDSYYGGGYYAEMLKAVYPAIKEVDPQAQVVIGGLLLDCDPTNPPAGRECKPSHFLEGILRNDGGEYFDVVSFHGYPPYDGTLQQDENFAGWAARGGVVLGKIDFLREVLAEHGVDKPILHTEGSLICPEWNTNQCNPPGQAFYEAQADYVVWLFVRNWAEDLLGTTWYQFEGPGWRYGGMLDENQEPKPVYDSYRFLTEILSNMSYEGRLPQYSELKAFEFSGVGKRVWVLWAPDETPHSISLPTGVQRVYDKFGNDITPTSALLEISHPVYIELSP
jgi:hypothetical protein